ncbi:MAG: HIT domain-containing protein [Bacillota bacterium]
MERLWAPWRAVYVTQTKDEDKADCIFCAKLNDTKDAENFLLVRRELCFALMNLYPYNNGHLLLSPNRHVADITELTPDESVALFRLTQEMVELIRRVMGPHGFNIGINLGRVAGAGFPGHFHIHIVPRWDGDTSFMPVVGDVKVISEGLEQTYMKLRQGLKSMEEEAGK